MTETLAQRRSEWIARVDGFARDAAPRLRPFAAALVELVAPAPGARILDVATGSGIVAVEAARLVGSDGSVLATDFVAEWEPHVRATAAEAAPGAASVQFATMSAEALALPDASFDVVFCQFGLMFATDPVLALREMRRVLRPGGRIGVAVWSVPERVGIFLISRIVGDALPPADEPPLPSPMGMSAPGLLEELAAEAGFREVHVAAVTRSYDIHDAEAEWERWSADPISPMAADVRELSLLERQQLGKAVIAALESFRDGDVIRVPSEALVLVANR